MGVSVGPVSSRSIFPGKYVQNTRTKGFSCLTQGEVEKKREKTRVRFRTANMND